MVGGLIVRFVPLAACGCLAASGGGDRLFRGHLVGAAGVRLRQAVVRCAVQYTQVRALTR